MSANRLRRAISMETISSTRRNKSLQKQFKHAFRSVRIKAQVPLEFQTADIHLLTTLSQESAATVEVSSCRSLLEELLDDYHLETMDDVDNDPEFFDYTHDDLKDDLVMFLQSLRPEPSVTSDEGLDEFAFDDFQGLAYQCGQDYVSAVSMSDEASRRSSPSSPSVHFEEKEMYTDEDDWDSSSVPTIDDDELSSESSRSGGVYYHEIFTGKNLGIKGKGRLDHFPYNYTPNLEYARRLVN
ncbi:hypothetical protein K7432_003657 [Basidiobolus ranarum]|uniref:Uncharacterized protein n=1 Tax=Basidiobolus ranarum TaxID=34480 RepID=A0ABR2WZI9_9FUNG